MTKINKKDRRDLKLCYRFISRHIQRRKDFRLDPIDFWAQMDWLPGLYGRALGLSAGVRIERRFESLVIVYRGQDYYLPAGGWYVG